jgi:cobalt/nickel transport protein
VKAYKKYILIFGAMIVLLPLGLIIPHLFKAGDAWGEWSVESVKKQTGIEPAGMKKDASIYKAPLPDYNIGNNGDPLTKHSVSYIISGLIGTAIILILTFGAVKLMSRKQQE